MATRDPSVVVTIDGDYVDAICWRWYGTTAGRIVEQVYEANPGLAARGLRLPAGVPIELPVIEAPAAAGPPVASIFD